MNNLFVSLIVLLVFALESLTNALSQQHRPRVAIIGGGVAGLSCAHQLARQYHVTVFDTGRLRPGGRCASRLPKDAPNPKADQVSSILNEYRIDHAAQIIIMNEQEDDSATKFRAFNQQVKEWKMQGTLKEFTMNSLFQITNNKAEGDTNKSTTIVVEPLASSADSYFYAPSGMASIPLTMQQATKDTYNANFELCQDIWVSPSNGLRYNFQTQQWALMSNGKTLGQDFDKVIIAHNGKCADRLVSQTPAKLVHKLLQVNFRPTVTATAKRMTLNSIYSLSIAVKPNSVLSKSLAAEFKCGMIQKNANLSFLTCQTNKLHNENDNNNDYEIWTILSTAKLASQYKAPQEFLPEDIIDRVSTTMIHALETLLDLPNNQLYPAIVEKRLQLWGAALPLNIYENQSGFIWDDKYQIGVCGDWLMEASLRGAWTSGYQLGQHVLECGKSSKKRNFVDGLRGSFRPSVAVGEAGIGALTTKTSRKLDASEFTTVANH